MLSASVEISLVYQVTSPLACPPEDDASKFADEEEQSGVDAARRPGGAARRGAPLMFCNAAWHQLELAIYLSSSIVMMMLGDDVD